MAINDAKTMLLRATYAAWLAHFTIALGALFLCAEMMLFGLLTASTSIANEDLLRLGAVAASFPASLWFRHLGVRFAQFREQEEQLDLCFRIEARWRSPYARQLERIVAMIEQTRGWERQRARCVARRWLARVHAKLGPAEQEFAAAHLGYLLPRR